MQTAAAGASRLQRPFAWMAGSAMPEDKIPETKDERRATSAGLLSADREAMLGEIEFVRASKVLGPEGRLRTLFELLAERSLNGGALKDVEIGVYVMGKTVADSSDSAARVYVFRLRQRLESIYRSPKAAGRRPLSIPLGEYRLAIGEPLPLPEDTTPLELVNAAPSFGARRWLIAAAAVLMLNIAGWAAFAVLRHTGSSFSGGKLWADIAVDDGPLIIAVGDYYVFGEYVNRVELRRLVRDFKVNSKEDLVATYLNSPDQFDRYSDVGLRYLPASASYALIDLAKIIELRKDVQVKLASDITTSDLKHADIIYVGLINGLGPLRDRVFAKSRYAISPDYNRITDQTSGKIYTSEALFAAPTDTMYRDYGLISTFEGVTGNRIVVIAGTQNTALMGMTEQVTRGDGLREIETASAGAHDFEALFEVKGQKSVNLHTDLLGWAKLDSSAVWSPADLVKAE